METTRIPTVQDLEDGTAVEHARPLCLTWCDAQGSGIVELGSDEALAEYWLRHLLTTERSGTEFIGWNCNRFDTLIVCRALAHSAEAMRRFVIRPFSSGQGLRLVSIASIADPKKRWSILDGKAMTGISDDLAKFAVKFCPDKPKLDIKLTEGAAFDIGNADHRSYAIRDAEIVYHGIKRANDIVLEEFARPLRATIGALAVRIFGDNLPAAQKIWAPYTDAQQEVLRTYVRRGGMVDASRYDGSLWYYDMNQAYASVMRDYDMPCGSMRKVSFFADDLCGIYLIWLHHVREPQKVPFTCVDVNKTVRTLVGTRGEGILTWATSDEVRALRGCGWSVDVRWGWVWSGKFRMKEFVDRCEAVRIDMTHGGPKSAVGQMLKAIPCNVFGKTLEKEYWTEEVWTSGRPGAEWRRNPFRLDTPNSWIRGAPEQRTQAYHQPQIGSFITAATRCKLFEAANLAPDNFVMCDTDGLGTSAPIHERLPISDTRYGAWKIVHEAVRFIVIGKKCYMNMETGEATCKGLRVNELRADDFIEWHTTGEPPIQKIVSLINFRSVLAERKMYRVLERSGTDPIKHHVRGWETHEKTG